MAMAKIANYTISATLSAKTVGGKVNILKFSVESNEHDLDLCL